MRTLFVLGSFFLQPLLWLAILRSWLTSRARIKRERHDFSSAVYSDHYELRHMLTQGLVLGVGLSLVNLIVGVSLPLVWVLVYEALAFISLIILPITLLPVTLLVVSTLVTTYLGPQLIPAIDLKPLGLSWGAVPAGSFAWLLVLVFLALGHWIAHYGGRFVSPRIYAKQRGKRIAGYPWRELLVVPLVTLVPGDWFSSTWRFWPMLTLHGHSFAVMILPLLLGVRFTVFREQPRVVYQRLARHLVGLAGLALLAMGWLFWRPQDLPVVLVILLVCYGGCLWRAKRYDQRQSFWYSQVDDGVRVLAIRPGTPAMKLDLAAGDIILECNHRAVNSENAFYEALLINPTYCHLRVRNMAGDLKVTETAIYSGAPHEIGIVLFRDQEG
ncbi:PDZ domain-containing protein [Levilactobacillus zymae]|uniref:PDZ domain-containing protein n=1 Tax=Levilactobacillus zymae TaxID=267363 RepID=UPI003FCCAA24